MSAMTVSLEGCKVDAVRADMLKGQVKITFTTSLDEQMLEAKRLLAILAFDESLVDLTVTEQQMRLPFRVEGRKVVSDVE